MTECDVFCNRLLIHTIVICLGFRAMDQIWSGSYYYLLKSIGYGGQKIELTWVVKNLLGMVFKHHATP
jgi:hypothetical protein